MDLSTPEAVRDFLALCLDPGHGIKRSPTTLTKITPGPLRDALVRFAPHLGELHQAAEEADRRAAAARKAYADGLAAWIKTGEQPAAADPPAADLGQCRQNRTGTYIRIEDPAQYGPHFYQEHETGDLRCVFCDVSAHWGGEAERTPRVPTYVHNARSVNRTTAKHLVDPLNPRATLCPRSLVASAPMPSDEAARLPLCGGCRRAVTGQQD